MSPVALPQDARAELMNQADKVRQRLQSSGFQDFGRFAELSGSRAIVAPGKSVVVRLLPRWDIAQQYIRKGTQLVRDPKYPNKKRTTIFAPAIAHWITSPTNNKPQRLWCRLLLNKPKEGEQPDPNRVPERCPICEAVSALINGSEDDKRMAKDIHGKDCYLFNAIIRGPNGANSYTDNGEPAIRILNAPPTVWVSIIDTMTGGPEAQEGFAKGEIFDPTEGFDIMITRPASGGNDRYKVACGNNPLPLFTAAEAERWKGWTNRLHNLETEISANILSFNDMWKAFYNREPEAGEGMDTPPPTNQPAAMDFGGGSGEEGADTSIDPSQFETAQDTPGEEASAELAPGEFDGIGMPGVEEPAPAPAPARAPAKAAPQAAAPARPAPRPAARRH